MQLIKKGPFSFRTSTKMTQTIPVELAVMVFDRAEDFGYCKLLEYFGQETRFKLTNVDLKEVSSCPLAEVEPKLEVVSLRPDGKSNTSKSGGAYYARIVTSFEVKGRYYTIEREIGLWISDVLSQVTKVTSVLRNEEGKELLKF